MTHNANGRVIQRAWSAGFLHVMEEHWTNYTIMTAYCIVTLLEELLTDEFTPTTTQIPWPTRVTDVRTLQCYLLNTAHQHHTHQINSAIHYIHTRLTALCPGLPGWAGTRKVKPIWILLKQETVSGSGIRWAICKSAHRSRQITMPSPPPLCFYRPDALPVAQPTLSKHWRLSTTVTK